MAEKRVALLKRANKYFRQGKASAAIKEYMKILAIKPDDLEVRRIVGDLQLRQNSAPEAIEQFEWIADYYLKEGFFAKSIAMYKRITRVDPNYEQALFKLGDLYTKQGLVMEAKQIYLDIAEECKQQNNQKKALDMYKKILEFDRSNIKMRLLLADNYLKEGLKDSAVNEYITAADILLNKKDYRRVEEILTNTLRKIKNIRIIEKLIYLYTKQGDDDKAIDMLKNLGVEVFKNTDLLKVMGELYLKKNLVGEAENIFSKIVEINPEETEVIMRLGKVYLQREEYDKTYQLFLPIIDKNIADKKFEEAASLLRFIIASNNSYLPALTKLADIFKLGGKTNNLIALYESLIPVYEQNNMKDQLKKILEELIQLSDSPFSYEEQLGRLTGQKAKEVAAEQVEKESEREREFVSFNLRTVEDALKVSDYNKAVEVLKKAKTSFPRNVAIREKLFDVYLMDEQTDPAVEEGKGLLGLYKLLKRNNEYADLLEKLSKIKPYDEQLVALSGDEETNIEIDVDKDMLAEQMESIGTHDEMPLQMQGDHELSDDVLLLSEAENVTSSPLPAEAESSKSLSSVLSEVDFYVNDGYFGDAEKLIEQLKKKYPGSPALLSKIEKFEKAKKEARQNEDTGISGDEFEIEGSNVEGVSDIEMEFDLNVEKTAPPKVERESTERIHDHFDDVFELEPLIGDGGAAAGVEESPMIHENQDSGVEIDIGGLGDSGVGLNLSEEEEFSPPVPENLPPFETPAPIAPTVTELPPPPLDEDMFEIESSIAEESHSAQGLEDSKIGINMGDLGTEKPAEDEVKVKDDAYDDLDAAGFEIEVEGDEDSADDVPVMEIDKDQLIQSPSVEPGEKVPDPREHSSSGSAEFDLDSIMNDEESGHELDSPFKEMTSPEMAYDSDEFLLKDDGLFLDGEAYLEIEKNVAQELEAIAHWIKELEKQRTSTIEKNMMEIFEEFKRGVDEKIGKEDYDTRYNLGIAYKEMGLLEEAIHEFLISSKHPLKFFDSAGLLGMCFRDKGMFSEAINWFEKALETPDRKKEECLAIKYELAVTLKSKEDYKAAAKMIEDILHENPNFRNADELYNEIKTLMT